MRLMVRLARLAPRIFLLIFLPDAIIFYDVYNLKCPELVSQGRVRVKLAN